MPIGVAVSYTSPCTNFSLRYAQTEDRLHLRNIQNKFDISFGLHYLCHTN